MAVTADGRVVVVDTGTGNEVRQLMTGVRTDDPAKNDIAVTPDLLRWHGTDTPQTVTDDIIVAAW